MKKILLLLAILLPISISANAQAKHKANKETVRWHYELEPVAEGQSGSYKVKVWSFSKKKHVAEEQCKKNAVHGIIFKGYAANGRIRAQKALVPEFNAEEIHEEFFTKFFSTNGDYLKFVNVTSHVPEVIKRKKDYKVGMVVTVHKDALRKYLEDAGIIKKLGAGF